MARPKGPHKPECGCISCKSRRRAQEAILGRVGPPTDGPQPLALMVPPAPAPSEPVLDGNIPAQEVLVGVAPPRMRDRIAQWIAWKAVEPELTMLEASTRMGLSPKTLSGYVANAVKAGWLKFHDPLDRIEHEIIPQTLDNLAEFLKAKDRVVTVETAKGTIFKHYQESKGLLNPSTTILAIKIDLPDSAIAESKANVVAGQIVGVGRAPTVTKIIDIQAEEVK